MVHERAFDAVVAGCVRSRGEQILDLDDHEHVGPQHVVESVETTGDEVTVILRGQVDLRTAEQLDQCLCACRDAGCSCVTVDMSSVTFLDSSGLRALISPLRYLPLENLVVRDPSPQVRKLLELTGMGYLIGTSSPNE